MAKGPKKTVLVTHQRERRCMTLRATMPTAMANMVWEKTA